VTTQGADLRIGEFGVAALSTAAVTQSHELGVEINSGSFTYVREAMAEMIFFPWQVYLTERLFPGVRWLVGIF